MCDEWQDLKLAIRRLRHSPGFALTAVVSLAMAIAANLVVFGVFNASVTREMGIAHSDQLWQVLQKPQGLINQSYPDYQDFKARNKTFSDLAAYRPSEAAMRTQGWVRALWDYEVSGNYFDVLDVQPELGRFFHASDEHGVNSAPYVVLSDACWRTIFAADPRVIGATVEVNKEPMTVIGVAPPSFHGSELFLWPDFWVPLVETHDSQYFEARYLHNLSVVGRLKPGVTAQQAAENLNAVGAQMAKQNPNTDDQLGARLVHPGMFGDQFGGVVRNFLLGVLLLALLTLAAACTNLACLFAARAADRSRELAVRIAIGSSRWRVLRQVLAEALVLSAAGGLAGVYVATMLLRWLGAWRPISEYPIHVTLVADWHVYAIAVLLATGSGLLPALMTAQQIWKTDAMQAMRGTSQSVLRRFTVRDVLLGIQVALCALLVTCGLVGLRGLERSLRAPVGFEAQGVMLAETEMKMAHYTETSALPVEKKMITQAEQMPGVVAAGMIDTLPMNGGGGSTPFYRAGTTEFRNSTSAGMARYFTISPGYLRAAKTRLMAGRDFTWHDDASTQPVAIINQTMAHVLFGNSPALSRHFLQPGPTVLTVIGVVEDGKYGSLAENPTAAMFFPLGQSNSNECTLVVRSGRRSEDLGAALKTMVESTDPSLPVRIESWRDGLQLALLPVRLATVALGILGCLAALLAATGIFGMASYAVAQRLRELGIRVALGAQRRQVLGAALRRTLWLLTIGSAAGLGLGVLGSRVLASIVYEATVYDPMVLILAVAAMAAIGTLATLGPARRAILVNPVALLREL